MQLLLTSSRALAGVVAALLVASMLSVVTTATAHAAVAQKLTVAVTASGPVPMVDGEVHLFRWDDATQEFKEDARDEAGANGSTATASFEVSPGTYYARYRSWIPDVVSPAFSEGASTEPLLATDPGTFTVTAGVAASTHISLAMRATLSGSLSHPDGSPVTGAHAYLYPADAAPGAAHSYWTWVEDGSFRIPVDPGTWRVEIRTLDENHLDHTYADVTVVAQSERLTLPAVQLRRAPQASVSGEVTFQGSPRAGLEVRLFRITVHGDLASVSSSTTDGNGAYTLGGVRDDRTYTVRVQGKGISTAHLGGSSDPAEAVTFTAADGPRLPTIDTVPAAEVSGRLLADGTPVRGYVYVYSVTASGAHVWQGHAETDKDGTWSIEVPAGNYVIKAHASEAPFLVTYLGSQHSQDAAQAGSFHVESGESITKDVRMFPAPTLVGSVSADGAPLAGVSVQAWFWVESSRSWEFISEDRTGPDGTYLLPAREGQRLTLRFAKEGYLTEYLGGGPSRPTSPTATNTVTAKGRTTSVPTFTLEGTVQVTPVPPEPEPVKQAKATLKVKAAKKVRADKRASVRVRVLTVGRKNAMRAATGHVVVKMRAKGNVKGKKVRTLRVKLKNGRAALKLPKLSKGKWAVKVAYQGNARTLRASKQYALKVMAPKRKR